MPTMIMPKMGDGMEGGTIVTWIKSDQGRQAGRAVKRSSGRRNTRILHGQGRVRVPAHQEPQASSSARH